MSRVRQKFQRHLAATLAAIGLVTTAPAPAVDWILDPELEGLWGEPDNWDGPVPRSVSSAGGARIANGGTAVIPAGYVVPGSPGVVIGSVDGGTVRQEGGELNLGGLMILGELEGEHGTYIMEDGLLNQHELRQTTQITVGRAGQGHFLQHGGRVQTPGNLVLGQFDGEQTLGLYEMHGGELVVGEQLTLGRHSETSSIGIFTQHGGDVEIEVINIQRGRDNASHYEIFDGSLQARLLRNIGAAPDRAAFRQHGGSVNVTGDGALARFANTQAEQFGGTFYAQAMILGNGWLQGYSTAESGAFRQEGGTMRVGVMAIDALNTLELAGDGLTVDYGLSVQGELDFRNTEASLSIDAGVLDIAEATIVNASDATLSLAEQAVLRIAPGQDVEAIFGQVNSQGIVHLAGDSLHVPAAQQIHLANSWDDGLDVHGRVVGVPNATTYLRGPVVVRESGAIDQKAGRLSLHVRDQGSRLEGGEIDVDDFFVGHGTNAGRFTQVDGRVDASTLTLSSSWRVSVPGAAGMGEYLIVDGSIDVISLSVGDSGPGTMHQIGGAITVSQSMSVRGSAGNSLYQIDGGTLHVLNPLPGSNAPRLRIGNGRNHSHSAEFVQHGGQVIVDAPIWVGQYSEGWDEYRMFGGSLQAEALVVGHRSGSFEQYDGHVTVERLVVGDTQNYSGGTMFTSGRYELDGGSLEADEVIIGNQGKALMIQTGGTFQVHGELTLTYSGAGWELGTYQMHGGLLQAHTRNVGRSYGYTLDFSKLPDFVVIGPENHNWGHFQQTGGSVRVEHLHVSEEATYEQLGGSLFVAGSLVPMGTMDFGGEASTLTLEEGASADFTDGELRGTEQLHLVAEANTLVRFGPGADPLTAGQFASFITDGLVHVAGEPLEIPANSFVRADGVIAGQVTNRGELRPGRSPGVLELQGGFVQSDSGSIEIEIAGDDNGHPGDIQFDQLIVDGPAELAGTLKLRLIDGYQPELGDVFEIILADAIVGSFDNHQGLHIAPGLMFEPLYQADAVQLLVVVPEPTTLGLLLAPLLPALARRRRLAPA